MDHQAPTVLSDDLEQQETFTYHVKKYYIYKTSRAASSIGSACLNSTAISWSPTFPAALIHYLWAAQKNPVIHHLLALQQTWSAKQHPVWGNDDIEIEEALTMHIMQPNKIWEVHKLKPACFPKVPLISNKRLNPSWLSTSLPSWVIYPGACSIQVSRRGYKKMWVTTFNEILKFPALCFFHCATELALRP